MPFLIGMCVTSLLGLDLEGVVVVDLDMASVSVGAAGCGIGKGHGTAELLPWAGCVQPPRLSPADLQRLTWVWASFWCAIQELLCLCLVCHVEAGL